MTDNIRIMTEFDIAKTQQNYKSNLLVYGTYGYNEISLGNGNINDRVTAQTLNHETIHETLTEKLSDKISFLFDRDLFYNFNVCTKSPSFKGLTVREALLELFTIDEITFI